MAITKIQTGGIPDASVTHAKLHGTMDLTGKTVTLPSIDMGSNNITTTGKILFANIYAQVADLPSASTYHGMFAHVHATGKAYYAHAGAWIVLANDTDKLNLSGGALTGEVTSTNTFKAHSSSSGDYVRMYGGAGTGKWDIYGNGANLRFSDNESAGIVAIDTGATFGGNVGIGTASPARQLSIVDDGTNSQAIMEVVSANDDVAGIFLGRANNTNIGGMRYFHSTNHLALRSNDVDAVIIDSSGNLNIGAHDSSNPLTYLRFGATQYGAADIRPSDEGGHKVGLDFYTDGTGDVTINPTFAMRINKDGNVGIGTNSPQSRLHILSDNTASVASNGAAIKGIQLSRTSGSGENLYMYTSSAAGWNGSAYVGRIESYGNNVLEIGTQQNVPISFGTSNTERMRIDGSGRVTTPNQPAFRAIYTGSSVGLQNQYFPWNNVNGSYNSFDIGGNFRTSSSGTNANSFTCPVAGRYYFVVTTICNTVNTNGAWYIRRNNSAVVEQHTSQTSSGWTAHTMNAVINCAANDYINVWVGGTSLTMYGTAWGHFSGYLIG